MDRLVKKFLVQAENIKVEVQVNGHKSLSQYNDPD